MNINASDIVDGRPPVILGLIWTIILYFQVWKLLLGNDLQVFNFIFFFRSKSILTSYDSTASRRETSGKPSQGECHYINMFFVHDTNKPMFISGSRWKIGARNSLIQWCREIITAQYGIPIDNFGVSWRDGRAFLALLSSISPGRSRN